LVDALGAIVDSVAYRDNDPWPSDPDGNGPSLELKDAQADNNDGANWHPSGYATGVIINGNEVMGTPGQPNSAGSTGGGPAVIVNLEGFSFVPRHAVIAAGDSVRWVNVEPTAHNVNGLQAVYPGNSESFFSGPAAPGAWQFDYEFNNPGLNEYRCDPHVDLDMLGTVAVYDPNGFTPFPLTHLRLTDGVNGQHIFDGVPTVVRGIVHGINFQPAGYSFYIINEDNVGINVFSFDPQGYEVQEGDDISVLGTIDNFNGLLEIVPFEIILHAQGQPLVEPLQITAPSEEVEGSHVIITGYVLDSIVATGVTGYNVYVTTFEDVQVLIRVDADSGIPLNVIESSDGVRGIGTQFDNTFPFTEGYQVLALQFFILPGFPTLDQKAIVMSPNPANESLFLESEYPVSQVCIYSAEGKKILEDKPDAVNIELNVSTLSAGIYFVRAITDSGTWASKLLISR
jgi:plastocyanin